MRGTEPAEVREAILAAALTCFGRRGLAKTSLEDVAREAGVSRATVYRYFPEGREQVVSETITWEVARFWRRLADEVAAEPDLAAKLRRGLVFGHHAIAEHQLLQRVLRTEPELLLAELSTSGPLVVAVLRDAIADMLAGESLPPGVDTEEAADYLARLFLSVMGSPGLWDLDDPDAVGRLVDTRFLAGILAR